MSQQQSPWVEGAYGWSFGESGWNPGMDQNLLKFSFLFDRNVDSIVASLPPAVNGQAHYNTVDNRLYFAVGTTYYSCPVPKWFSVIVKPSGDVWQFNGVNLVQIDSPSDLDIRLDSLELTASQLGTAAFEDVAFFASQSALDVVEANSQAYTDVLRTDLADSVDQTKGASLVGFDPALIYPTTTVGGYLNYTPSLNPIIVYDWDDSTGTDNSTALQAYVDSTYVSPTVVGRGRIDLLNGRAAAISSTIQILQKTLDLSGSEGLLKWTGTAGLPMVRVVDSSRCRISDMILLGDITNTPSAAIYFEAEAPLATLGTNENHVVERVIIGRRWLTDTTTGGSTDATPAGKITNGIVIGGAIDGNNDEYTIRNCQIHSAVDAGIDFKNSQSIWSMIDGVLTNDCNVGVRVGCNMNATHLTFNRNKVADLEGIRNTEMWINGFESENAKLAIWSKGGASFFVRGGKILINQATPGNFTRTENGGVLSLNDMLIVSSGAGAQTFYFRAASVKTGAFRLRGCTITNGSQRDTYDIDTGIISSQQHEIDIEHGEFIFKTRAPYLDRAVTPASAADGSSALIGSGSAKTPLTSFFQVAYQTAIGNQHLTVATDAATQVRARVSNVSGGALQLAPGRIRWMAMDDHVQSIGSLAIDVPLLAAGAGQTVNIPVAGAQIGDFTLHTTDVSYTGPTITSYVSAPGVVSLRVQNQSGGPSDPASAVLSAAVIRPSGNFMGGLIDPGIVGMAAGSTTTRSVTVTGAQLGAHALVAYTADILGVTMTAHVSAANTVTVVISNLTAAPVNFPAGGFKVMVMF